MKRCARRRCPNPLDGKRRDARYCSDECRYAAWAGKREKSGDNGSQRLSVERSRKPRAQVEVYEHDFGPGGGFRPSLVRKLNRAADRLGGR